MREKPKHTTGISKHIRYVLSHKLDAFQDTVKTSYRMPRDLRTEFNEECAYLGVSTCFVIRELMHNWIQGRKIARACPTAGRFTKRENENFTPWRYYPEAMSLIRWKKKPSASIDKYIVQATQV